jgi:hypothetical protein
MRDGFFEGALLREPASALWAVFQVIVDLQVKLRISFGIVKEMPMLSCL